jgi:neutral ceramidase
MMLAGSAQVDITPSLGTHLAGDGMGIHRPARKVLDPLYAKALVLESGGKRVCILAMDLLCVTLEYTRRIREEAARRHGLDPQAIMVHVEQNHAAPSLGSLMLDPDFPFSAPTDKEYIAGSEARYCEVAVSGALEAIGRASAELRHVEVGWGRGVVEGLAFNRRGVRTDGTICMPWFYAREKMPRGPVHIRYLEGPFDPEVGVLCLRDESKRPVAMLLSYACHPVNLFATDKLAVSADWPGAWAAAVREEHGEGCVPIVLNGACGNLNPWPPFTPDFVPDHRRMGQALADMSRRVIEGMSYRDSDRLDARARRLPLDYRDIPPARREEAARILHEHPGMQWDPARGEVDSAWFLAASTMSTEYCRRRWPRFPYEIQAFRIGDAAVVGLPGEPFVEGQLEIKTASPAPFVCVAHMCTQYVGYLPTREAAARGGHEAWDKHTYWAKLAPDSLERIVGNARAMVGELFPPGSV